MQNIMRGESGVFRPREIEEMREELKRGDTPAETALEREQRAIVILQRHRLGKTAVSDMRGPRANGAAKGALPG
jgi:hypothetical protein